MPTRHTLGMCSMSAQLFALGAGVDAAGKKPFRSDYLNASAPHLYLVGPLFRLFDVFSMQEL